MSEHIKPKFTLEETVAEKNDKCVEGFALSVFNIWSAPEISRSALNKRVVKKIRKDVWTAVTTDFLAYTYEPRHEALFDGMVSEGVVQVPAESKDFYAELQSMPFIHTWEEKTGESTVLYAGMPDEIREALNQNLPRYHELIKLGLLINNYAKSAVTLYGVVTLEEIVELYKRWHPKTWLTLDIAFEILSFREVEDDSNYVIRGDNNICSMVFDGAPNKKIEAFKKVALQRPRWQPKDEAEFFEFRSEEAFTGTKNAQNLEDFFRRHGLKDRSRAFLLQVLKMRQMDSTPQEVVGLVIKKCKLKKDAELDEMCHLMMEFLNNCHLRILNGWTPTELLIRNIVASQGN